MKKIVIGILSLASIAATGPQQKTTSEGTVYDNLRAVENRAFEPGEKLEYRVHYGFVDAGIARIEVKKEERKVKGREVYHIVGTGKSKGAFDWFFKVNDRYETYIDAEGIFPWAFVRRVDEGGYKINQDYIFHQDKKVVDNGKGKKFEVEHGMQDMLSSFYYARTIDFSNAKIGDVYTVNSFIDDEVYPLQMKYMGTETIKVDKGKFNCLKFAPVVQKGRIFKDDEDLMVWITNDENKIPVLAQAKILVGSIKMELQNYEGLRNPVAKVN